TVLDLIADINTANKAGGSNTITLTAPTTSPYVLTVVNNTTDGATGLPVIANKDILTIIGNDDTIDASRVGSAPGAGAGTGSRSRPVGSTNWKRGWKARRRRFVVGLTTESRPKQPGRAAVLRSRNAHAEIRAEPAHLLTCHRSQLAMLYAAFGPTRMTVFG